MENKEILEGNTLIAEFMLVKVPERHYLEMNRELQYYADSISEYGTANDMVSENELKYHSSWDWLMLVAEKIRTISVGDKSINENLAYKIEMESHAMAFSCAIYKTWWPRTGTYKQDVVAARRDTTSLIDVTFIAIIKFIKWYNQQKQAS